MKDHTYRKIIFCSLLFAVSKLAMAQSTGLDIATYELAMRLDLDQQGAFAPLNTLSAKAAISFTNRNDSPVTHVSVVLHRLLLVEEVRNKRAEPLKFTQRLARLDGWEKYQANVVTIALERPLPSGGQTKVEIDYAGQVVGIRESGMLYVQDSLDPDFTIIRAESAIYPHLAEPTGDSLRYRFGKGGDVFEQSISITAPNDLTVASGLVVSDKKPNDELTTWEFRSNKPSTQIVVAVAPYDVIDTSDARVYFFSEDKEGAQRVAKGIHDAKKLFHEWFGPLREDPSIAVVEIPEWYGSQAQRPTVILDARAFRSASSMPQLYHEVSHFWNVRDLELAPSRWNEGLAMYLQEVVRLQLDEDATDLASTWNNSFQSLKSHLSEQPDYRDVPLIQAGERHLTSVLSYRAGQLMFALLERRLGRQQLFDVLGSFYQEFAASGATSAQFAEFLLLQEPSAQRIIDEWFLGSIYSELVLAEPHFDALVSRYQ